ncbi:MAG TPA: septation regulator SpoVG [Acholeplasmataceae bacterium]|jgi:stage V sporulation protein G|nr:septation regulator SpoVG [Acholeplasmataceae bacterium]
MKFTDVRIRRIQNQNRLRAVASVTIDDAFVIHEIRVIEGARGIFVAMPSRKNKYGVYKDVAHPINQETRAEIERVVLAEFNKQEAEAEQEKHEEAVEEKAEAEEAKEGEEKKEE